LLFLESGHCPFFFRTVIRVLNKVKGGGVAGSAADPCRPFTVL